MVATNPARAREMSGNAVADDFGIGDAAHPTHLRTAVKAIIPSLDEFASAAAIRDDVLSRSHAWKPISTKHQPGARP